ncbi:MAG: hypothetical protein AAB932_03895 [Patescibacteria group bacterium]
MIMKNTLVAVLFLVLFFSGCQGRPLGFANYAEEKLADDGTVQNGKLIVVVDLMYSGRADVDPGWEITHPDELAIIRKLISNLPLAPDVQWPAHAIGGFQIRSEGVPNLPKHISVSSDIVVLGNFEDAVYLRDKEYMLAKYLAMLAKKQDNATNTMPQWVLDAPPYPSTSTEQ